MLLTCPSCSARYEAPDSAFPPEGRVVECSACGTRWLQPGPDRTAAAGEAAARPAGRPEIPGLSEAAAALADLRGDERRTGPEGADEAAAEAASGNEAETKPGSDAGDAAEEGPLVTRAGLERARRGEPEEPEVEAPAAAAEPAPPVAAPAPPKPAKRDLPDAARLNADLRSEAFVEEPRRRGGFMLGMILALIVGGAAIGAYVARDRIAEAAPEAAPMLESYAVAVDEARLATERTADEALAAGQGLVDAARGAMSGFLELKPPAEEAPEETPAEDAQGEPRSDG